MPLLFLILLALPAHAEEWVRVKLSLEDVATISIQGTISRLQGLESAQKFTALPQKQNLLVRWDQGQWIVQGFKNHSLIFKQKFLALHGADIFINNKKMPEKLILNFDKKSIQVIGILPLEKYIMGVLAHEMPAQWPLETLKAQAIATRSYTIAVMKARSVKSYHLESTVMDQVYSFLSDEELQSRFDKITEAVRLTRGQVLESTKKNILKAYYHADCGGETASAQEAWATNEELVSVKDNSCPQNPKARWNLRLSSSDLSQRLKKWAPNGAQKITQLKSLTSLGRVRVAQVEITWDQGRSKKIEASLFREAMGFFDFKSTQFEILNIGEGWRFEGRGFGHGVGLCQWGSRFLGLQGLEYRKILEHYYPKAQLKILEGTMLGFVNQIPL